MRISSIANYAAEARDMVIMELCLSPGVGGLELYALKVIRHYQHAPPQDISCIPVVRSNSFLDERLEKIGIKRCHLNVTSAYLPLLAARQLASIIDRQQVDVLHIHWGHDLPLAAFAVKFCHRPVRLIYTRQMALTRRKYDFYHRFLYKQIDLYLTITEQLQAEAERFLPLPKDRIRTLYYGVPEPAQTSSQLCEEVFNKADFKRNIFTIALFGRIEYGKGQHLLLEAVQLLAAHGHEVQALLVGHIMDQTYFDGLMKSVEKYELNDRFKYFGFHDYPTAIMPCFDAVVLATKKETFGLVLAEAMRAGTTVVGSNAGGVPEIIRHRETGLLFEPENAHDLADCLETLVRDPALKESMAKQGKQYADRMFSEETHFEKLGGYLAG